VRTGKPAGFASRQANTGTYREDRGVDVYLEHGPVLSPKMLQAFFEDLFKGWEAIGGFNDSAIFLHRPALEKNQGPRRGKFWTKGRKIEN